MFPISKKYIDKYNIDNNQFLQMIYEIINNNKKVIINACQNYLEQCEKGNKHSMIPNIDGILAWIDNKT
ncbi:hypothetical protein LX19_02574 [Clostridium thermopalmarium DSM 5974]|uniref:hypothetical protein n=1 Tax=Clostridium thermopalmarium TaxID=29373 RepID=UPI000D5F6383|nr:hypothetical protein [Clostridium thermopalmarium]PVZ20846.1 hypothetical protein LX19_02574 [Clostridium thermopalmarium DSM 5974]